MDGVLEKFSIFDFFNLIFTGFIFLMSLQFLNIFLFDYISSIFYNSKFISMLFAKIGQADNDTTTSILISYFIFLMSISYIIGSFIQEIGLFMQDKITKVQDRTISNILNDDTIVKGGIKRQICVKEARELFQKKNIKYSKKGKFTSDQCHYFYTYCIYYIQIREQHKKTEKMRNLHGISSMLSTNFALSVLIGIIFHILFPNILQTSYIKNIDINYLIIILIIYSLLAIMFWMRMKKHILHRIRMVLNTYEVNVDKES